MSKGYSKHQKWGCDLGFLMSVKKVLSLSLFVTFQTYLFTPDTQETEIQNSSTPAFSTTLPVLSGLYTLIAFRSFPKVSWQRIDKSQHLSRQRRLFLRVFIHKESRTLLFPPLPPSCGKSSLWLHAPDNYIFNPFIPVFLIFNISWEIPTH